MKSALRSRILAVPALLLFPVMLHSASSGDPLAWVKKDKIRMGWSPDRFEQYQMMADAGMNAVMPRLELDVTVNYQPDQFERALSPRDSGILADLLKGSSLAKTLGLRYFHCLGLACESQTYTEGFRDNTARFNDGKLPSPLDPVYWQRVILDRTDRALRLLSDREIYALDAIIIDPEMYALNDALPGEPDYGTFAFELFLKDTGRGAVAADTPQARRAWLEKENLGDTYVKWQFERVKAMGRQLRELVDSYRPDLIIGYIIYENRMWFNAMAAGMTTEKIPVFVGPESTYSGVMDDKMITLLEGMKKSLNVPCLLTPGVDLGLVKKRVPLERLKVLEGNIYQRCQHSDGYWVYAIYNFGTTDAEQAPFFATLKVVNEALDQQAKTGEVSTALKAGPIPVEVPAGFQNVLHGAQDMAPIAPETAQAKLPFVEPKLRGTYTQLLWPKPGVRQFVTIRSIQLNPSYLDRSEAQLFDRKGDQIYDGPAELNETRTIWLPDVVDGFCAQVLSGGMNAVGIQDVNCPTMIYTDDMVVVNTREPLAGRFYFHVPEGKSSFAVKLIGHPGMTADYVLYDAASKPVRNWKALKAETEETVPVSAPGVWCMEIKNLINDGGFRLMDLPNYFALRPGDVMIAKTP